MTFSLILEIIWILTNIASGNNTISEALFFGRGKDHHLMIQFMESMMKSGNLMVKSSLVWFIRNLISEDEPLAKILVDKCKLVQWLICLGNQSSSSLEHVTWNLNSLARFDLIEANDLPQVIQFLVYCAKIQDETLEY